MARSIESSPSSWTETPAEPNFGEVTQCPPGYLFPGTSASTSANTHSRPGEAPGCSSATLLGSVKSISASFRSIWAKMSRWAKMSPGDVSPVRSSTMCVSLTSLSTLPPPRAATLRETVGLARSSRWSRASSRVPEPCPRPLAQPSQRCPRLWIGSWQRCPGSRRCVLPPRPTTYVRARASSVAAPSLVLWDRNPPRTGESVSVPSSCVFASTNRPASIEFQFDDHAHDASFASQAAGDIPPAIESALCRLHRRGVASREFPQRPHAPGGDRPPSSRASTRSRRPIGSATIDPDNFYALVVRSGGDINTTGTPTPRPTS